MLIAQGAGAAPLAAVEAGARATLFLPRAEPRSARKAWIAGALNPAGAVIVDDGARPALAARQEPAAGRRGRVSRAISSAATAVIVRDRRRRPRSGRGLSA